ncbi:hypothetical protein DUI87_03246 [Hirundo rustica rustica]|uniref:Peptidase A2 domain-containing protein n=1 Tax=Hirundo rustica rustica TaxID=333673 RepID=A0A3M0L300_HIRRU|nr:hypothetical protein DUI87_03246 [Hirundo rustica rustica]
MCGEPQSDCLRRTICRFHSDPELLPPGAQCELAASKLTCFMNENHAVISTGVTGTSWKRQEFLIIGKDRSSILGLIIYPTVISENQNEELTVLAQALRAPLTVLENTPIAKAVALPPDATERQVMPINSQQAAAESEDTETHVCWVKLIGQDRPKITCNLMLDNKMITITGMLDTGANVTVISYIFWPKEWDLTTPLKSLSGIGGATLCMQSENSIIITGPDGKTAIVRPFVVQKSITVWGRDIISQWGIRIEVDF